MAEAISAVDYTQLVLSLDGVVAEAFVVQKRRGGFLLAVPEGAIPEDLFAAAEASGFAGEWGPSGNEPLAVCSIG